MLPNRFSLYRSALWQRFADGIQRSDHGMVDVEDRGISYICLVFPKQCINDG